MEFVLTGSDGMLRVLTSEGSEIISKEVGTYKQGKPIVADLDSDGNKEVLIQDASGKINVLSFDPSSSQGAPDLIWTFQGFGKMAKYFRSFTPLVSDLEGDGKKEIILALSKINPINVPTPTAATNSVPNLNAVPIKEPLFSLSERTCFFIFDFAIFRRVLKSSGVLIF